MTIHVRPLPDGGWEARGAMVIGAIGPTREEALQAFYRVLNLHSRIAWDIHDAPAETEIDTEFPPELATKLTS